MDGEVAQVIADSKEQLDNPEWLSKAIIRLSSINYSVAKEAALARLAEEAAILNHLNSPQLEGKKMTKTEAETRAIVETNNAHEGYDNMYNAINELVNSFKKRIEVLAWEFKRG